VADPGPGLDALAGVAGLTPRLAWAVGRHDDGVAYRTLIERWDGTTWQRVPSPNVGSEPNSLNDVAVIGPDDAWAVGWHVAGRRDRRGRASDRRSGAAAPGHAARWQRLAADRADRGPLATSMVGVRDDRRLRTHLGRRHPLGVSRLLRVARGQRLCARLTAQG